MKGSVRSIVLVQGAALFAMFFGAGNLIFPPALGRSFGADFIPSMLGFLLTGVGLPLMGVLAVARADGGIDQFARRVDPWFARALTVIIMLAIGPFFAIPRTCATTFELAIAPNTALIGPWLFAGLYFAAVLFFALRPLSAVDRIGKILTPLLLASLVALIAKGALSPIGVAVATGREHAFGLSLVEGYQTMDLLAASIFGIIILNDIRNRGIGSASRQVAMIAQAGVIAAACLGVIYVGLLYLGATTSSLAGSFTRTELLVLVAQKLFGAKGALVLGTAVSMACLTTAIGLTVVCGEYFSKLSRGLLSYPAVCIGTALVSLVIAVVGVEAIIRTSMPVLIAVYPVVMVLVLLCLAGPRFASPNLWRGAVIGALVIGVVESIYTLGLCTEGLVWFRQHLPFCEHGLGWVVPAIALGILGSFLRPRAPKQFRILVVVPDQRATRLTLFDGQASISEAVIPHRPERPSTPEELGAFIGNVTAGFAAHLAKERLEPSSIAAAVARGGVRKPVPPGAYRISEALRRDIGEHAWRWHPSHLGAVIAGEIAAAHGFLSLLIDPVVIDEQEEVARFTGLPESRRLGRFNAAAHRAVLHQAARDLWKHPARLRAVVAWLGDEVSIAAYRHGRAVDVTDAVDGEGPFSGRNAGALPAVDIIQLSFAPGTTVEALLQRLRQEGGLAAYLGTADAGEISARIKGGDAWAIEIVEAMGYAVAKGIAAQAVALGGRVDVIALAGPLTACDLLVDAIRKRLAFLGTVLIVPESVETQELLEGSLPVLRGRRKPLEYVSQT